MPIIGHIGAFDPDVETFRSYESRIKQYFEANAIPDGRQRAALISTIGAKGYKTLQDLFAPNDPCAQPVADLFTALRNHYSPKPLQLAERFRLHKCTQSESQNITDFIATLRSLSLNCGYEADPLDFTLRDIFIAGLRNAHIQRELLTKDNALSFADACTIAKQLEAASKEVSKLTNARSDTHVKTVASRKKSSKPSHDRKPQRDKDEQRRKPCFRCGSEHLPDTCKFRDVTCHYCNKKGHIDKVCLSKKRDTSAKMTSSRNANRRRVNQIQDEEQRDYDDEIIQMVLRDDTGNSHPVKSDKFWVAPKINGCEIDFEIDTGAAVSLLPRSTFDQNFKNARLLPTDKILRTYTNDVIPTSGMWKCNVEIHGQRRRLTLYVTETGTNALFGRDWLRALKLNWAEIKAINSATSTSTKQLLQNTLQQFAAVFEPGFGNFIGTNAKFYLRENAKPAFAKARNVPYSLRAKVDTELNRLETAGIICPVKNSDWASPICCVPKSNGTVRICGDFKSKLNPL